MAAVSSASGEFFEVHLLDDCCPECIFLEVSVINPITRKLDDGELVTTYAIYIETNDSAFTMSKSMVRRRYSDFVTLRSILLEQHPSTTVPKLPGRTFFGKRFDQRFIQERCHSLQIFLKEIIEQPVFLSNKSLHLFLQSSLPMDKVQNVANGAESFELPHNNAPLILRPVDAKKPTGRVGILKQESCASLSLASNVEHECCIKTKHQHIRVGSGIVVCPFVPGAHQAMASSAPFNIPGQQHSPVNIRSCASDTCLDGAVSGGNGASSLNGSKKRVSFFIEKENKRSLMSKVAEVHSSQDVTA
ncbi:uncharacterized protein LOC100904087 isoform X2 [Galendromus occidentalis]|uniref:Uncharacterized protein LOC100904087 isoform X2 n=1 Tax=Galendromus occidentalis TaxID=34638 RepID=A0AAJ6QTN8_9ACAR|nr:uncharacterized protein LOC100904087 isoform X2 [Galendromus occidentalis]